jgi:hypothetical protein
MKQLLLIIFISTFSFSGFYDTANEIASKKSEYIENERLCRLFTKKAEVYKQNMRDDLLAKASLASYEHRAKMFCQRAEEAKKSL